MSEVMDGIRISKYSEYKDSGINWLGQIPKHWEIQKGKWLFIKQERPASKDDGIVTCFRDGEVTLRTNRKTDGFTIALKEHGYQGIRKGDLVIHNMDAFAGAIGVSDSDGKSTPVYSACTARIPNTVNPYYYAYFLKDLAKSGFIESLAKGIRERSTDFRFNDFGLLLLSVPPPEEQTAIAQFLDRKTAQIDQAIAQKEKQIELLKERRQILIHKAVTRGLNPNVKCKDSGVEWIGEIPEHWEVKPLRFIGTTQNGVSKGAEYFGSGFPFVGYSDVYQGNQLPNEVTGLAESTLGDRIQYSVLSGDVFFTRTSETVEEIGFASTCLATIVDATFSGFLIRFRPTNNIIDKNFSKYYFSSKTHRAFFVKEMNLVIRASLSQDLLKKMPVLLPPIKEQIEIANYLDGSTSMIATAISLKEKEIEKLKEYKATLINSAVTGKIKVS
jgi:type I restriction enzyme, S subunit